MLQLSESKHTKHVIQGSYLFSFVNFVFCPATLKHNYMYFMLCTSKYLFYNFFLHVNNSIQLILIHVPHWWMRLNKILKKQKNKRVV